MHTPSVASGVLQQHLGPIPTEYPIGPEAGSDAIADPYDGDGALRIT
jgi:hypothetical protein